MTNIVAYKKAKANVENNSTFYRSCCKLEPLQNNLLPQHVHRGKEWWRSLFARHSNTHHHEVLAFLPSFFFLEMANLFFNHGLFPTFNCREALNRVCQLLFNFFRAGFFGQQLTA